MSTTTYGLDVAKRVFQLFWIDGETGEIANRRFGRERVQVRDKHLARTTQESIFGAMRCDDVHWVAAGDHMRAEGGDDVLDQWELPG